MRSLLFAFLMLFLASGANAANAGKSPDEETLRGFMAGNYDVIGRLPDSTVTYTGKMVIEEKGKTLHVTRTINGKKQKTTLRFDTVAGEDRIPVLRMRFTLEGVEHEATYRWQSDPDNYPRFTGFVYRKDHQTKSPGLEALFPVHS